MSAACDSRSAFCRLLSRSSITSAGTYGGNWLRYACMALATIRFFVASAPVSSCISLICAGVIGLAGGLMAGSAAGDGWVAGEAGFGAVDVEEGCWANAETEKATKQTAV